MLSPTTVFMFSGQGSHYFQMGQELFETTAVFREWMERLDMMIQGRIRQSIIKVLYAPCHRKADLFDRTTLTHPAIFMVEYALARCLMCEGLQPDCVLGVSLGSFAAAAVAGFLSPEEAVDIVLQQAIAIERHSEPGGMIAVMAPPSLHQAEELSACSELAAINFFPHFTLAARACDLARIEVALSARRIPFQRLPVSVAFHSHWIDAAQIPFMQSVRTVVRLGRLPLACCECGDLLLKLPHDYFWRVTRNPIRFQDTIARLEHGGPKHYIDVGPAGTLATFLKYILPPESLSTSNAILTQYGHDLDSIAKVFDAVKRRPKVPAGALE